MTGSLLERRDREPYSLYEELRARGPVAWDDGLRAWLVLGHAECVVVERREDLFEPGMGSLRGAAEVTGERSILTMRGQPHAALHKLLSLAMTPAACAAFADRLVRPAVDVLVDRVAPLGRCELHAAVGELVPLGVVRSLLGFEPASEPELRVTKGHMDRVLAWRHTYGEVDDVLEAAREASRALDEEMVDTVRARAVEPRDDLISELWAAGRALLDDWSERDVLDQCKVLYEAGVETTALALGSVAYVLATDGEVRERVERERGEALARCVEETLRLHTPVQMRVRRATQDVELGGALVRRGDRVHPVNAAANRDPERWGEPDRFSLDRRGWAAHLTFNVGPRQCVGAALARLEVVETITAMLDRWPGFELDPAEPPPGFAGFVARSFRPLHLRWRTP